MYLCFRVKKEHPPLADANHAGGGKAALADLLGQESVGAEQRQSGHELWKTEDSDKYNYHWLQFLQESRGDETE